MGKVTLKLDDAELLRDLEEMASLHGTTVETEAYSALQSAVADYRVRLERVRRSREIRAMTPAGVVQQDSVEIIREMRDERDSELGC